jgi:hypothetical protein
MIEPCPGPGSGSVFLMTEYVALMRRIRWGRGGQCTFAAACADYAIEVCVCITCGIAGQSEQREDHKERLNEMHCYVCIFVRVAETYCRGREERIMKVWSGSKIEALFNFFFVLRNTVQRKSIASNSSLPVPSSALSSAPLPVPLVHSASISHSRAHTFLTQLDSPNSCLTLREALLPPCHITSSCR